MLMLTKVNRKTIIVQSQPGSDFYDNNEVWNKLLETTQKAGLSILAVVKHDFYPQGFSGAIILGESHVAIHTFPENNEAWIEIATCDDGGGINRFEENLPMEWRWFND
jgi:S-adenosylmethionine decarboxylase